MQAKKRGKAYRNVSAPALVDPSECVFDRQGIPVGEVGPRWGEPENSTVHIHPSLLLSSTERDSEAASNSRLDSNFRLCPVRSLDNDAERRPASSAEREEQVLVLTLVRGAEDSVRSDDFHLDLAISKRGYRAVDGDLI